MSNDIINQLDWDIEPDRDLWPQIQSGIRFRRQEKSSTRTWMPMAVAACLMLAVGAFVMSTMSYMQAQQTHQMQANFIEFQKAKIALIEQEHAGVRAQFVALLDGQLGDVNPQTAAELRQVLMTIDQASAEIKAAMLAQPLNTSYANKLAQTYQEEVNLLKQIQSANGLSI